jgi:hypothetical protein
LDPLDREHDKSTFYHILINNSPYEPFLASIGINQGDTLSPFIFNLVLEGMACILSKSKENRQLKGCSYSPLEEALPHLLFFDDTMLIGTTTIQEVEAFKHVLDTFLIDYGGQLNDSKSSIFFFNICLIV